MKKLITLLTFLFCFILSSWAWIGDSYITFNGTWYTGSNSYEQPAGFFAGTNLGKITNSFTLGGEVQLWPATTEAVTLGYKIVQNESTIGDVGYLELPFFENAGNNSKHQAINAGTISVTELAAGNYELHVWFSYNSEYDNKSGDNFIATFTVVKGAITTLTAPSKVFIDETITLDATSENVTNPIYSYSVKVPESDNYVAATQPYQPTVVGTYTFKVEVAEQGEEGIILNEDTKDVVVKAVPEPITIKFKIPVEWTSQVISIHYWNDDIAGNFVTATISNGDWYTYTFERMEVVNVIFINGENWTGQNADQTSDIKDITTSTCYNVKSELDGELKRVASIVNCGGEGTNNPTIVNNTISITAENNQIRATFDGTKQIQLYSASGQLLHAGTAKNIFEHSATTGIYLLKIDNQAYKLLIQ